MWIRIAVEVIYIYFSYIFALYFVSSCMCLLSTYLQNTKVLESIPGFPHWFKSQIDLNPIIDLTQHSYFRFHIWNLVLQPTRNRFNLTMWIFWCPSPRTYTPLSWPWPTLKSRPHYLHTRNTIIFLRRVPLDGPDGVFCNNKPVDTNESVPNSILNKQNNSIFYHRMR